MSPQVLRILQVSAADRAGGAERSAHQLFECYRERGHRSWLAVGRKHGDDPDVIAIPDAAARGAWVRAWDAAVRRIDAAPVRVRGAGRAARWLRAAGEPLRALDVARGREDFHHPGSRRLLELVPQSPQLVHLHNLHGGYFDLRTLPSLSARVPTVLNLRDAWLLAGHCAFPLGCERWRHGCGRCPDLDLYPAVRRDATAFNWRRKRDLFTRTRVHVTAPSRWLLDRARASMLAPAIADARVIGNGVDTRVFHPGARDAARRALGIANGTPVLMTTAGALNGDVWKDRTALREALARLEQDWHGAPLLVLALGASESQQSTARRTIRFLPHEHDSETLAGYYRAADAYVHAARAESFGNVLLEARACGTPVVSTAVGGIPEHVKGLACPAAAPGLPAHGPGEANGILTACGDARAMSAALAQLLGDHALRDRLGVNAARDAAAEWSLGRQADRFLDWYREILATRSRGP
jgi:glycosyltransferase involved in cell wall biosynthesis